jgi:hypothetical protein
MFGYSEVKFPVFAALSVFDFKFAVVTADFSKTNAADAR